MWRWLTSMRTALLLLLLLAIAAVPGSVWPQRGVSAENVNAYLRQHPGSGPWLDRFSFFDVYSSPWFSAIYLLLFVSLVGCLVPRLRQHIGNIVSSPPDAPSRLERLPHSATGLTRNGDPTTDAANNPVANSPAAKDSVANDPAGDNPAADSLGTTADPVTAGAAVAATFKRQRWRTVVRTHDDGTVTVSGEKGYIKETGNLVFHFALLSLLIGIALGSWYGWHGNRLLVVGESGFCNNLQQYDEYGLGARTSAEDLPPFCVTLNSFHAAYLDNGQPVQYTADVSYSEGLKGSDQRWRLEVNDPLRLSGANVYLLGHGYAPILRYTDRYGVSQTRVTPFLPVDGMLTSSGTVKYPDVNVDPTGKTPRDLSSQMAFVGVYLPTMPKVADGHLSAYPGERDPGLQLTAYRGNLGLGTGLPQSVYDLDQAQIRSGQLNKVAETKALKPGQTWTLPDGTSVQFVGTRQWISVSVRNDPGETIVLGGAAALLVGLMVSLTGKRRRVWARVSTADDGRSLISLGGLARSDHPGFGDEFDRLAALVVTPVNDSRQPVAVKERRP
jgi:cytochrome c biogenesis protein